MYLMSSGLACLMQLSYSNGQRAFLSFCMLFGIYNEAFGILPASEIAIFVLYSLCSSVLQTLNNKILFVSRVLIACRQRFENHLENKPRIQLVLRGIKHLSGNPRRLCCPITPELFLVIRSRLNLLSYWLLLIYPGTKFWYILCCPLYGVCEIRFRFHTGLNSERGRTTPRRMGSLLHHRVLFTIAKQWGNIFRQFLQQ